MTVQTRSSPIVLTDRLPRWAWLALGVLGSLLTGPRWSVPLLAWVAPVPYLVYARGSQGRRDFLRLLSVQVLAACLQILTIVTEPMPAVMALGFGLPLGLLWWASTAGAELLRRRAGEDVGMFAYAALTALSSFVGYGASELGTWMATANSQVDQLAFAQLGSLVGLSGLGFLMAWTAALIARGCASGAPGKLVSHSVALSLVLVSAVLWGAVRLAGSAPARTVAVAAVVTDVGPGAAGMPSPAALAANTERLFERTRRAAERGARLIVWNEAATLVEPGEEHALVERGRTTARALGVDLVLAYAVRLRREPLLLDNKYQFIGDDGRVLDTYRKHHPVPGEPSLRGAGALHVLDRPYGRVGGAICYDYDFPAMAREHARAGAELVVVPSSDWRGIDPVHTSMSRMRAIEGGFALLRSTRWAASAAFDAYGRVRAFSSVDESNDGVMLATVPIEHAPTLYAAVGELPAALAALYLVVAVVLSSRILATRRTSWTTIAPCSTSSTS